MQASDFEALEYRKKLSVRIMSSSLSLVSSSDFYRRSNIVDKYSRDGVDNLKIRPNDALKSVFLVPRLTMRGLFSLLHFFLIIIVSYV